MIYLEGCLLSALLLGLLEGELVATAGLGSLVHLLSDAADALAVSHLGAGALGHPALGAGALGHLAGSGSCHFCFFFCITVSVVKHFFIFLVVKNCFILQ